MLQKLTACIQDTHKFGFLSRLYERLWLPIFLLILQGLLTYHFLYRGESFLAQDTMMGSVAIFIKCMFRATLWASLFWWLVALPKSTKIYRGIAALVVLLVVIAHLLESFLLSVYGMCFSHPVLLVLAGTNSQEAQEYWNSTFSLLPFIRPCLEIVLASAFSYIVLRMTQHSQRTKQEAQKKRVVAIILYGVSVLLTLVILLIPTPRTYEWVM